MGSDQTSGKGIAGTDKMQSGTGTESMRWRFVNEVGLLCILASALAFALWAFGFTGMFRPSRMIATDLLIIVVFLVIYLGTEDRKTPLQLLLPTKEPTRHEKPETNPEQAATGTAAAIEYCEGEIEFYGDVFNYNHARWKRSQTVIIVFGAVSTLIGAATLPDGLGWLKGIPGAVVTIAAGIAGSFNFQRDAIRQGMTSDALQGELAKFRARADPYSKGEQENVSMFLANVRAIIEAEQGEWQSQMQHPIRQSAIGGAAPTHSHD